VQPLSIDAHSSVSARSAEITRLVLIVFIRMPPCICPDDPGVRLLNQTNENPFGSLLRVSVYNNSERNARMENFACIPEQAALK
jgi:hypothetical protein